MRSPRPLMPSPRPWLVVALLAASLVAPAIATEYVPPRHEWQRRAPAQAGFDAKRLAEAVAYAPA